MFETCAIAGGGIGKERLHVLELVVVRSPGNGAAFCNRLLCVTKSTKNTKVEP